MRAMAPFDFWWVARARVRVDLSSSPKRARMQAWALAVRRDCQSVLAQSCACGERLRASVENLP